MCCYGVYNEVTYRENFKKPFDSQLFNRTLIQTTGSGHFVVAFDPSHIKKSGTKTFGVGYFYGAARAVQGTTYLPSSGVRQSLKKEGKISFYAIF